MSFIRTAKRENPFVQLDKYFLGDEELSFEAKGIMAYILSKPDTWTIRKNDMIKRSKSGKTRIETAMLELMANGYLNWYRLREEDGTFGEWVYDVYERPEFNPEANKFIQEGKLRIEKRRAKNKAKAKNKINTKDDSIIDKKSSLEEIDYDLPTGMGISLEQPKTDIPSLVSPKVDNPTLDNPTLDNPPYSNNELSNNELNKKDEEEDIYKLRADNITFDFIFNSLTEKGFNKDTANAVIRSCQEQGLENVTVDDVEKQYSHMMEMKSRGEMIYDFTSYFVTGLNRLTEQTIANRLYTKRKHQNTSERVIEPVPFYNWLEVRE